VDEVAPIERLGVVGCGQMGSGIAEVSARAGLAVVVVEATEQAARSGQERLARSLRRAVEGGKLPEAEAEAALARVQLTTELEALAGCDLVVEAIVEDGAAKRELFGRLDRILADGAVLATNTSSIPIATIANATSRPEAVVGLHFFNPVPVLPLVELVRSLATSPATAARARAFAEVQLGKHVIDAPDRAGFVVNALLVPYLLSAIRMVEAGLATPEDVDVGMTKGCAHPIGPLALVDLIGLDTTLAVAESLYAELADPACAPPPLLRRMVDAGRLGRKSGRGFYEHSQ